MSVSSIKTPIGLGDWRDGRKRPVLRRRRSKLVLPPRHASGTHATVPNARIPQASDATTKAHSTCHNTPLGEDPCRAATLSNSALQARSNWSAPCGEGILQHFRNTSDSFGHCSLLRPGGYVYNRRSATRSSTNAWMTSRCVYGVPQRRSRAFLPRILFAPYAFIDALCAVANNVAQIENVGMNAKTTVRRQRCSALSHRRRRARAGLQATTDLR